MPRPRFEKLPEPKRMQILEAAAKEFAKHGFANASFNRILEQAGVSKGAAYYYFDDKADLFFATIEHYGGSWTEELLQIDPATLDRDTYWPTLMDVYRQPFVRYFDTPWAFGVIQVAGQLSEGLVRGGKLNGYYVRLMGWISALIRRGQELGLVRTDLPEELLFTLIGGFDQASDEWLLRHWEALDRAEVERIATQMADMMRRIMSP
jgi:AcrR family transcriptional regulator